MRLMAGLGPQALAALAEAMAQGRLCPPYGAASVGRHVAAAQREGVAAELVRLDGLGLGAAQIGVLLRGLAEERRAAQQIRDEVELVWSGPEGVATRSRDTGAVVRALFRGARESVLVSSYNLDHKEEKARALFAPLAQNLDRYPKMVVRMFVNVQRGRGEEEMGEEEVLARFARRFVGHRWPGRRLPEVYYDPRALAPIAEGEQRACLHAKCVVVDGERVLVTSANFTEAAHARNIEAGVLMRDRQAAADLRAQFEGLVQVGALLQMALSD